MDWHVREAGLHDNERLLELTTLCPMQGSIGLCSERAPDFFTLNRLEGSSFLVGVVEVDDTLAGCIAVSWRPAYVNGDVVELSYISDLKVRPEFRGKGVADELILWARRLCTDTGAASMGLATILGGNSSMLRRLAEPSTTGAGGLGNLQPVATIGSYSIPLLWRRSPDSASDTTVERAAEADLDEMAELWQGFALSRQFAEPRTPGEFRRWLASAPNLLIDDYLVARDNKSRRIKGFCAVWDQTSFKQLRITRYSPGLAAFRFGFNALASLYQATRLPPAGDELRLASVLSPCADGASTLRSLLIAAYADLKDRGMSFMTIGLDKSDDLAAATRGLMAQCTDVILCAGWNDPGRPEVGLDGRPSFHEICLV